jgi:hypothetical protein
MFVHDRQLADVRVLQLGGERRQRSQSAFFRGPSNDSNDSTDYFIMAGVTCPNCPIPMNDRHDASICSTKETDVTVTVYS